MNTASFVDRIIYGTIATLNLHSRRGKLELGSAIKQFSNNVDMTFSQTKGQLEAKISVAITQFEREHLGHGPQEVRTWIIYDMILVRLKRVLTPAEEKLARDPEGHRLVKEVRRQLIEGSSSILHKMILDLTGVELVSLHSDISIKTGERIFVFSLAQDLESKLR